MEQAKKNGISVLYINYSQLWLSENDKAAVSELVISILRDYSIATTNIYVGGMSIGGNTTLTMTQYWLKNKILSIEGAFFIDAPIDFNLS